MKIRRVEMMAAIVLCCGGVVSSETVHLMGSDRPVFIPRQSPARMNVRIVFFLFLFSLFCIVKWKGIRDPFCMCAAVEFKLKVI